MPDVARVLREEVQRLAKRQVKAGLAPIKRDTVRLKVDIAYVEATVSLGRLCLSVLR